MTPPVAPEAGPFALPRDQLGPGPGFCCALLKTLHQLTFSLSPSFPIRVLHQLLSSTLSHKHGKTTTACYTNWFPTTYGTHNSTFMHTHMHIIVSRCRRLCIIAVSQRMSKICQQSFGSLWIHGSLDGGQSQEVKCPEHPSDRTRRCLLGSRGIKNFTEYMQHCKKIFFISTW